MADGWTCDYCRFNYLDVLVQTKITVYLPAADYAATVTVCSLACFDGMRSDFEDIEAIGKEHYPEGRRRDRIVTEWKDENGNWSEEEDE